MKLRDDTLRTVHHHKEQGRNIQWSAWLVSVLVFNLLAGCAGPATTPFSPSLDSADAVQLGSGNHKISPYFGYFVEGGFFSGRRIFIYHVGNPQTGKKETLGITSIGWMGNTYYRPAVFAVSNDGRTLLYLHYEDPSRPDRRIAKESGLYEYIQGSGDRVVHSRVGTVEAGPLPRDAIIFSLPAQEGGLWEGGESYIRTTSGDEYPSDLQGGTALHRAAYFGEVEKIQELLQSGADIEARNGRGFTPLHEAIWRGKQEAVKLLLERGANVNAPIKTQGLDWAPLHEAARFGFNSIIDMLLEKGADINSGNTKGRTPLDVAVEYRQAGTVKHVVARGAKASSEELKGAGSH